MFSIQELSRYSRHLSLPGFGAEAQEKLKSAKALIIGAGGLGCPVIQYLAAAGIGSIGIIDNDTVSESNLQRQVLYSMNDVGRKKVEAAREWILNLNPFIHVNIYPERLTTGNALRYFAGYQLIIDCSDNFPTRYLVNDAAVLSGLPYVYGSIFRYEGQLAVFNVHNDKGASTNYRDLYPEPPSPGEIPSCEEAGVLGVLPGIIGSLQAMEAIKLLTGIGDSSAGAYFMLDALSLGLRKIQMVKNPANPLTGDSPSISSLVDYDAFCGMGPAMKEIHSLSAAEFKHLINSGEDFQLIDVRQPHEYLQSNLGGLLIPLASITEQVEQVSRDRKVIIHCSSGKRSMQAAQLLVGQFNFTNLYNLEGGMQAVNDQS